MTTVLFWDIDGTLLTTARAGVYALEEAAEAMVGHAVDLQEMHTSGLTDAQIAERILQSCGAASGSDQVAEFLDRYGAAVARHLPRRQGRVMTGVKEILQDLSGRGDVMSLLLTGNVHAGARAKLDHYGLLCWLADGAFCEGPGERVRIAEAALVIASERLGGPPDLERTYVIGDTPADIACGKAVGMRTIGVASGVYSVEELAAAGAWAALPSLPQPPEFRALVGLE